LPLTKNKKPPVFFHNRGAKESKPSKFPREFREEELRDFKPDTDNDTVKQRMETNPQESNFINRMNLAILALAARMQNYPVF